MRLREKRRPIGLTAVQLLKKLEQSCSYTGWGSTILYWARRHVEESGLSGDLRYGQPSSVEGWMKGNGFWDGKEQDAGQPNHI